jgi:hypothetical protein
MFVAAGLAGMTTEQARLSGERWADFFMTADQRFDPNRPGCCISILWDRAPALSRQRRKATA